MGSSGSRCWVVTGGAGFIGSRIASALAIRGDSVRIVDDFSTGRAENLNDIRGDVQVERGDIGDTSLLSRMLRGADGVLHEAAIPSVALSVTEPLACDRVNVHGTIGLLETARKAGIQRVLFAASAAAYGDDETLPKKEAFPPSPLSPYAVSKVAGEHYLKTYAHLYGMQTLSLRYFNVYGPGQNPESEYAAAIPRFVTAILSGKPPRVYGDGLQTRDFCHIDDVVAANLLALDAPALRGEVVNVACGTETTVLSLIERIQAICGTNLAPVHEPARKGDIKRSVADIAQAKHVLGYAPRVGLDDGLRGTVAYFRARLGFSS